MAGNDGRSDSVRSS